MTISQGLQAPKYVVTEEEFKRLPADGRKYELVDGEVREVPASVRHDQIVIRLARCMGEAADAVGILVGSQAGFRMRNGNVRCPDLSFIRYERLPNGEAPETFGDFAPDLCIEVISPTEEPADMRRKLQEYFEAGTQQVWHMFPVAQTIRVFTSPTDFVEYAADMEINAASLIPGFRAPVSELFAVQRRPNL